MIRCQDNDNISSQKYKEFTYYASNFGGIMFFYITRGIVSSTFRIEVLV